MRSLSQRVALYLLRAYKWAISPMFPPACRYTPTCSEYAMEAIERFGVLRGGCKALLRLLRCHPFVKGGYDPVVKSESTARWKSDPAPAVKWEVAASWKGSRDPVVKSAAAPSWNGAPSRS